MRKTLVRIIRELKLLSFSWKKYYFLWNFFLAIFMGNPSLWLSEVLHNIFKPKFGNFKVILISYDGQNLTFVHLYYYNYKGKGRN